MSNSNPLGNSSVFLSHVVALIAMLFITYVTVPQAFQGKSIMHGDKLQSVAAKRDVLAMYQSDAKLANWTDRSYSGMPSTLIMGIYPNNLPKSVLIYIQQTIQQSEIIQLMWPMICLYVGLSFAGYSVWLSLLGAAAFALSTINIGNVDAGHSTKIMSIAAALPSLIGLSLLFKKHYWKGFILMALFGAFQIAANHLQITYYTLLLGIIIAVSGAISLFRSGESKALVKVTVVALASVFVSVLPNTSMLWSNYEYSKDTVRGKRILSKTENASAGLSQDYANVFSHDLLEMGSLFIPRLVGGGDKEKLDKDSETYKEIKRTGLLGNRLNGTKVSVPLFWGDKPLNEAPTYIGIVLFGLFVLSLFFVQRSFRYLSIALVLFCTLVAMGSHVGFVNTLMFDLIPFFNRFRAPSMILGLAGGIVAWTMVAGLSRFTQSPDLADAKKKKITMAIGTLAVVCLFFATIGPMLFDFSWNHGKEKYGIGIDENLQNQLLNAGNPADAVTGLIHAIKLDRSSAMRSDSFRSLLFLSVLALLAFGFYKKRVNQTMFIGSLVVLMAIDLIQVDHRYIDDDDFVDNKSLNQQLLPAESDVSIAKLRTPYDRVLDLSGSLWTDAKPSYFHPSIGGNHAAKLRRYQDLIDNHLTNEIAQIKSGNRVADVPALNMLNARFIKAGYGPKGYLENVTSLGYGWFVDSIAWVNTAEEEMMKVGGLDGANHAVVNREFESFLTNLSPDSSSFSKIELTYKEPGKIIYETSTDQNRLLVMSEIWYRPNEYWLSYIDDELVDHIRVNYLLRGIVVPEGVHSIRFEYHAVPFEKGEPISAAGSTLWILAIASALIFQLKKVRYQSLTEEKS